MCTCDLKNYNPSEASVAPTKSLFSSEIIYPMDLDGLVVVD